MEIEFQWILNNNLYSLPFDYKKLILSNLLNLCLHKQKKSTTKYILKETNNQKS